MHQKVKSKNILLSLFSIIIIFVMMIPGVWYFRTVTSEDYQQALASLERVDRYILTADSDTIMVFSDFDGKETLKEGLQNLDSANYTPTTDFGLWVNNLPGFPSCEGRIAILQNERIKRCDVPSDTLHKAIDLQISRIQSQLHKYEKEFTALEYYMKTHSVIDQGFDLVVRYDKKERTARDSITRILNVLSKVSKTSKLRMIYSPEYSAWVKTDSDRVKVKCHLEKEERGLLILRTVNEQTPAAGTRLSIYNKVVAEYLRNKRRTFRSLLLIGKDIRVDSLGTYIGEMDSVRMSHGFGSLVSADSTYYEGEWVHGKREGFGFTVTEKMKLKVGEWKNDRYLGERINYNNNRIYGIDISRYQHQQGKKHFSINWSALRITSLGRKSRKNITGTVNYPISFIYIKSTEGVTVRNKYFLSDYRMARFHGYYVGAYHFFSPRRSGVSQARFFVSHTRYRRGDFPPVLDVEPTKEQIRKMGGTRAMFRQIRAWMHYVEKAWHIRPVLYVGQPFVNRYLPSAPDIMKNYDIWIARYGEYKPEVNLVYWQLCPDGRVRGIHGAVDINVFNGYEKEFKAFVH